MQAVENLIILPQGDIQMSQNGFLGQGGFGFVSRGRYQYMDVAVKTFTSPGQMTDAHRKEMILMKSLNHINLVRLYGLVCDDQQRPTQLVMEYAPLGNLHRYLLHHRQNNVMIDMTLRYKWAYDLACGLSYLHSKRVVHRDIKSSNAVLDRTGTAKWCDFGLSELKLSSTPIQQHQGNDYDVNKQVHGTIIYLAPELFKRGTSTPSRASDIWAYGMICYELLTFLLPFEQFFNNPNAHQSIKNSIIQCANPNTLPFPLPDLVPGSPPPTALHLVVLSCWRSPTQRPLARAIGDYWHTVISQMLPPAPPIQIPQQLVDPIALLNSMIGSWS